MSSEMQFILISGFICVVIAWQVQRTWISTAGDRAAAASDPAERLKDGIAWAGIALLVAVGGLTSVGCASRNWCSGTDGDAWMLTFFVAIPAMMAAIHLLDRRLTRWWIDRKGG